MNTHFWKYWACNGKFKPQHIYVLAIISSSFITLHDEIANSQCRVHNKCTDGSFCFIRNGKSTPILFNLLASTFRWKTFLFSITLFYLLPNRRGKFSEGSAFPCQQKWICFSMTEIKFCDCNRCKIISNTLLWDIIYNISGAPPLDMFWYIVEIFYFFKI